MRAACLVVAVSMVLLGPARARADGGPPPVAFADGATGTASASCGAGDECAALKLESGDRVVLYNAGAPHCKPYQLRVVRFHGDAVLFSSEQQTDKNADTSGPFGTTCGTFRTTVLTLANGHRLTINQAADGTLFARWDGGGSGAQAAVSEYDHPDRCVVKAGVLTVRVPWSDRGCRDARAYLMDRAGLPNAYDDVDMVDNHPKRCATGDKTQVTVMMWDAAGCAKAREGWAAAQRITIAATPQPSPRP